MPAGSQPIWLDSPVDSSSCDVGGPSGMAHLSPESPGVPVRLTIILLTISSTLTVFGARPAAGGSPDDRIEAAQIPSERSVVGTLEQVDVPIGIVVRTTSGKQTFALEKGITIRQGSRVIKVSELAAHKGERVKVRYRDIKGAHRAEWVVIASPPAPGKGRGA
jgi:hypothetical protein